MMIKVCSSSDWAGGLGSAGPLTSLVKVSSRGLIGNDRADFIKTASHQLVDQLEKIALKPGDVPIHSIALGAAEKWGCFAAGTPIAMGDGRYLPIEELEVGDEVLTAEGRISEVSCRFEREVSEGLLLDVCGLPAPLKVSTDHPFRVARFEQFQCDHDRYKRCLPPLQGQQNICQRPQKTRDCVLQEYREIQTEWSTAQEVRPGDFLMCTLPKLSPRRYPSLEEAYILGAWLAEGSFVKRTRKSGKTEICELSLSVGGHEEQFRDWLMRSMRREGVAASCYDARETSSTWMINTRRQAAWAQECQATFGEYSHGKRLPPWVCGLPRPTALSLLAGYLDGDGHAAVSGKENRCTLRTVSRDLAFGMQRLIWTLRCPATVCEVLDGEEGFNLSFPSSQLEDLQDYSWKFQSRELSQTSKIHGFYCRGRMYLPVREVSPVRESFVVHNMEVEGDHTYSGPNVDSHNCNRNGDEFSEKTCQKYHDTFVKLARWYRNHENKDPAKSYGYIAASAYNPEMSRVEVLGILNGTKEAAARNGGLVADKEMAILDRGDDLETSMACKIAYDQCSACGHKARTREEYCDEDSCTRMGCKTNLTKMADDGYVQSVDNPGPLAWFDNSTVFRKADRTAAGVMADWAQKAASAGTPGSAALAELLGVTAPIHVARYEELLPAIWDQKTAEQLKLAEGWAALERIMHTDAVPLDTVRGFGTSYEKAAFDSAPLGECGSGKMARALATLQQHAIVLPLPVFATYTGRAQWAKEAQELLPGIYGRMLKEGSLERRIHQNRFVAAPVANPSTAEWQWAKSAAAAFSLATDAIEERRWRSLVQGEEMPTLFFSSKQAASLESEELARDYAVYKLETVHALSGRNQDFSKIALGAVIANYVR